MKRSFPPELAQRGSARKSSTKGSIGIPLVDADRLGEVFFESREGPFFSLSAVSAIATT